jgi:AcrR family transcriptional regulator
MDVRRCLISTGVDMLEKSHIHALSLRAIARAAGVSHGAPRHHFPTYAALLAEIARRGADDLDAMLAPALAVPDATEALWSGAAVYVRFAIERPEMFELITRHDLLEGAGGNLREVTSSWFRAAAQALARLRGDAVPETQVLALWANVHGLAALLSRRTTDPIVAVAPEAALEAIFRVHL